MSLAIVEAARGRWPGILSALGVDSKYLRNIHGPCPMCGGKDRFRFDDKLNGCYFCSQCGSGDGFILLQKLNGWSFKEAAKQVESIVGKVEFKPAPKEATEDEKAERLRRILGESRRVESGSPAWIYLNRRCGVPGAILDDLRSHPGMKHSGDGNTYPVMLAILRYADGKGSSVHRTYLTPDGNKAPVDPAKKMMPGRALAGSAVRLGPVAEHIGIAEGIETAICAGKVFGLPVWSATSAPQLINWEPPAGVRVVTIFGDNDESCTGQAAAWTLAKRLKSEGLSVSVEIPAMVGTDWADYYQHAQEVA